VLETLEVETGRLQKAENLQPQEHNKNNNEIRDVKYTLLLCRLHQLPSSSAVSLPADI